MGTVRRDSKALEMFKVAMKDLDNLETRVGWFESSRYDDQNKTPVAYVATIQEFGSEKVGIPARPFFRPTIKAKQSEWITLTGNFAKLVARGQMTAYDAFEGLGQTAAADVRVAIGTLSTPALSPVTLMLRMMRKQGVKINRTQVGVAARRVANGEKATGVATDPLRDSGYMLSSLSSLTTKGNK